MKTTGILATGLILMIVSTNILNAATKCVALNTSSTCRVSGSNGQIDWTGTCGSVTVSGVGLCSSTMSGTKGKPADKLATSASDVNASCWCKMTSPVESKFIFAFNLSTSTACSNECARYCAHYLSYEADFRSGMLGNIL